jgi:hypothetical protein
MAITYALMQRFEELAEAEPERIKLVKKAKVTNVNIENNRALGVTYTFNGEETTLEPTLQKTPCSRSTGRTPSTCRPPTALTPLVTATRC